MPGSVPNATPTTVMPHSLCSAYTQSRAYGMEALDYADGRRERRLLTTTSRRRWDLSKRLTAAQLATLRAFFEARGGAAETFYFYDIWDVRTAVHDPTGAATLGRVTVRFDGAFSQSANWPRSEANFALVEVN